MEKDNQELSEVLKALQELARIKEEENAALRVREDKFRGVLEQFSDGFLLINEQGKVEEWNKALEDLTGLQRDAVLGRFAWDVQWDLMHLSQRNQMSLKTLEEIMLGLLNGDREPGPAYASDVIFVMADGQQKYARQSISVVKTSSGTKLGLVMHDITAQKAAEAALQDSEERYRRLVEFSPDAIFVHSAGQMEYVNAAAARMLGALSVEELIGKNIMDFVQPPNVDLIGDTAAVLLNTDKSSIRVPRKLMRLDGSLLDVEVTGLPFNHIGQPAEQLIVHDISERKQIELAQTFLGAHEWLSSGEDFFYALARFLATNMKMDYVCIDRLEGDGLSAQTLAIYFDGTFDDNLSYTLRDTPCANVPGKEICLYPNGVRHLFPNDTVLQEMSAESYLGTTLWDSKRQPIGLIALIGRRPLTNSSIIESTLKLVSVRAGAELQRRVAEEALRESEERYRQLVELSPSAVFVESQGKIVFANAACVRLFGAQNAGQLLERSNMDFVHPDYREIVLGRIQLLNQGEGNPPIEEKFLRLDGTAFDVEVSAASMSYGGKPARQIIVQDITDRKRAEQRLKEAHADLESQISRIEALQDRLREQAVRDYLTGLFNRRYLQNTLEREIARAAREKQPVSVVMMDVDHFKLVNDTYGHRSGDKLLETWGKVLKMNIRAEDIACRYGGEEFVIVMPGASLEVARQRAEWLCAYCADLDVSFEGQQLKMTMSMGVAAYPQHALDEDGLLIRADRALYRAKRAGRNQVSVFRE